MSDTVTEKDILAFIESRANQKLAFLSVSLCNNHYLEIVRMEKAK